MLFNEKNKKLSMLLLSSLRRMLPLPWLASSYTRARRSGRVNIMKEGLAKKARQTDFLVIAKRLPGACPAAKPLRCQLPSLLIYWEAWQLFARKSPSRPGWPAQSAKVAPPAPQAQRRKRKVLRGTGASSPLRVSHRAAAMMQKSPLALRAGRSSSARPRLA